MVHFGDFRVEHDIDGKPQNLEIFKQLGKRNILAAFLDSTNADIEGSSLPEKLIEKILKIYSETQKGERLWQLSPRF